MPTPSLQTRLLNWYNKNKRTLPWRDHPDAYAVWVSEIMLQQTRVETVIPYFQKWMRLFPTVKVLSQADEQAVLNAWEGLGYYSRARNLHKAAKIIVAEYGGKLPGEMNELLKLPGVGRYTAGAILSIVFEKDEPALDGNLKRVYARLFDMSEPVDSQTGDKLLWEIAYKNLPKGKAGDFNQALMDLGSSICIPKNPRCLICPLMELCLARKNRTQELRPVKKPKKESPHYVHAAAVIVQRGKVLLVQRPQKGLLAGMWEFPNVRVDDDPAKELVKAIKSEHNLKVQKKEAVGVFEHAYSHFSVTVHAFRCDLSNSNKKMKWISLKELDEYPMGKVDRSIASAIKKAS